MNKEILLDIGKIIVYKIFIPNGNWSVEKQCHVDYTGIHIKYKEVKNDVRQINYQNFIDWYQGDPKVYLNNYLDSLLIEEEWHLKKLRDKNDWHNRKIEIIIGDKKLLNEKE